MLSELQEGNLELVGPCDRNIGVVDPFLAEAHAASASARRYVSTNCS
jgi:hypothetical protein